MGYSDQKYYDRALEQVRGHCLWYCYRFRD